MSKGLRWALIGIVVLVVLGAVASVVAIRGSYSLDGTGWRLVGWSASSLDPVNFTITAAFAKSEIAGSSAVNSYSGPYSAGRGGSFSAGPLSSTLIAGPGDSMRAEQIYLELLDQARHYVREGSQLTLSDENDNQLLIFEPKK